MTFTRNAKKLDVFFIIDTSNEMAGDGINQLNEIMHSYITAFKDFQHDHVGECLIKVAVLEFGSGAMWITKYGSENISDFKFISPKTGGKAEIGAALRELNRKLSDDRFFNKSGICMPLFIFITPGHFTDDYRQSLDDLRQNRFFSYGTKLGVAVNDDADDKNIADIVGSSEAVIRNTPPGLFKRLLKGALMPPDIRMDWDD